MSPWWEDVYGDPCRECGTAWVVPFEVAVEQVAGVPDAVAQLLPRAGAPTGGWSATEYVVHTADTLRSWAERLTAALVGDPRVPAGYDADELAAARRYGSFDTGAALWTLRRATADWCDVVVAAHEAGAVVRHASRGSLTAHDIALRNRHGALHHVRDVEELLR